MMAWTPSPIQSKIGIRKKHPGEVKVTGVSSLHYTPGADYIKIY